MNVFHSVHQYRSNGRSRQLGVTATREAAHLRFTWCIVSIVVVGALGCGSQDADPRGVRVAVHGNVTLDGTPLSRARIVFLSEGEKGAVKATGSIEDGTYQIPQENGPLVGKSRVEIYSEMADFEEFEAAKASNKRVTRPSAVSRIPINYNTRSTLTADVQEQEENTFDFSLKSGAGRRR